MIPYKTKVKIAITLDGSLLKTIARLARYLKLTLPLNL
jgi:hypothetical protein